MKNKIGFLTSFNNIISKKIPEKYIKKYFSENEKIEKFLSEIDFLFIENNITDFISKYKDIIKFNGTVLLIGNDDFSFSDIDDLTEYKAKKVFFYNIESLTILSFDNCSTEENEIINDIFSFSEIITYDEDHFKSACMLSKITAQMTEEFTNALSLAGQKFGLDCSASELAARQTVSGSAILLDKSDEHPIEMVDRVCSPGGTTIEGLLSLKNDGFESVITKTAERIMK